MQHVLYFLPLPHGHASFLPSFTSTAPDTFLKTNSSTQCLANLQKSRPIAARNIAALNSFKANGAAGCSTAIEFQREYIEPAANMSVTFPE
jgi:hypothetical protein